MTSRVYIETSVISYLAARPSRDLILAAHQQISHEWWSMRHEWELGLVHKPGQVAVGWTSAAQSTNTGAGFGGLRSRSSTLLPGL